MAERAGMLGEPRHGRGKILERCGSVEQRVKPRIVEEGEREGEAFAMGAPSAHRRAH